MNPMPVFTIDVPSGAAAYDGIANIDEVLVLINHYPLENVGWQQSLQSDKPEIVDAIAQINR
jgi:hypothetical protein